MKSFEEIEKLNSIVNGLLQSDTYITFYISEDEKKDMTVRGVVYGEGVDIALMVYKIMVNQPAMFVMLVSVIAQYGKEHNIDIVKIFKEVIEK